VGNILSLVDWGYCPISLLKSAEELLPGKPAIIHIRHTERPGMSGPNSNTLLSTSRGRQAAIEFGEGLPARRNYRVYHTVVDRSKQSADSIIEGINRIGDKAEIAGVFPFRTSYDPQAMDDYIDRVFKRCGDEDLAVAEMMNRWLAGLAPQEIFRPSGEFARMIAEYTLLRLKTATPDNIDLYVTHDTWVGAILFHWFGLPIPLDGVRFLDGFILQPLDEEMAVWFRGKALRIEYPHWWGG
jgi:hypothetical protein